MGNCRRCGAELPPGALICKSCRKAATVSGQQPRSVPSPEAPSPPPASPQPVAAPRSVPVTRGGRRRWPIGGAALLLTILVAGGITLLLKEPATSTDGMNQVSLTGSLSLSQTLTPSCKLAANQTIYAVSATFPDPGHQDATRYHYLISFWIEAYHGPGTYPARDYHLDKVVLTHLAPDAGSGHPAPNATYVMTDRSGQATVDADGLSGSMEQDLTMGAGDRVHVAASWRCGRFEPLTQAG